MAFMTAAEIKAVRCKGSKVVVLEGLDKEVRIIKMAAEAQLASQELQAAVKEGKRAKSDMLRFMLEHALADLEGTPLSAEDAAQIFQLLSMPALSKLVTEIGALIGEGSVKTSEEAPAELTPAAKKD